MTCAISSRDIAVVGESGKRGVKGRPVFTRRQRGGVDLLDAAVGVGDPVATPHRHPVRTEPLQCRRDAGGRPTRCRIQDVSAEPVDDRFGRCPAFMPQVYATV